MHEHALIRAADHESPRRARDRRWLLAAETLGERFEGGVVRQCERLDERPTRIDVLRAQPGLPFVDLLGDRADDRIGPVITLTVRVANEAFGLGAPIQSEPSVQNREAP